MVDSSTQYLPSLPKIFRSVASQTGPMRHTLTLPQLTRVANQAEHFLTSTSSMRSTLYRELGSRLKMPNSLEAHMAVKVDFPGIPATGWKELFPSLEWHLSEDGATEVGMTLDPDILNQALSMERCSHYGLGCCKLVLPGSALVGRSCLAFVPPFQVWCNSETESGALQSILTAYLVILDESGELRTPPNHTYTDAEENLIQDVIRGNLEKMRHSEQPLSPMFLRLLGHPQEAAEVEEALEEKLESIAARKRRRQENQQVGEEASVEVTAEVTLTAQEVTATEEVG